MILHRFDMVDPTPDLGHARAPAIGELVTSSVLQRGCGVGDGFQHAFYYFKVTAQDVRPISDDYGVDQ
jgi:hypothetical protein